MLYNYLEHRQGYDDCMQGKAKNLISIEYLNGWYQAIELQVKYMNEGVKLNVLNS